MNAATAAEQSAVEIADEVVDRAEILAGGRVLVEFNRTAAALAELTERYAGKTYDLTTTAGDKAARAARLELVTLRTSLEAKRKELKAPVIEAGKTIDDEAKRITAAIVALEEPIDKQIKADEARREAEREAKRLAEAARVQKHEAGVAAIRAYATTAASQGSNDIAIAMDSLDRVDTGEEIFEEFAMTATRAKTETLAKLRELHQAAVEREAEAARLAAEREAQRAEAERQRAEAERLAAERAALEAQQAEIRRQQEELQRQQAEAAAREERQRALEAQAKAAEEARAKELEERAAHAAQQAERDELAQKALSAAPVRKTLPTPAPAHAPLPTLKLGDINARLGFTLTADFLAERGFVATVDRNARLFHESDWPAIKAALIAHIEKA